MPVLQTRGMASRSAVLLSGAAHLVLKWTLVTSVPMQMPASISLKVSASKITALSKAIWVPRADLDLIESFGILLVGNI